MASVDQICGHSLDASGIRASGSHCGVTDSDIVATASNAVANNQGQLIETVDFSFHGHSCQTIVRCVYDIQSVGGVSGTNIQTTSSSAGSTTYVESGANGGAAFAGMTYHVLVIDNDSTSQPDLSRLTLEFYTPSNPSAVISCEDSVAVAVNVDTGAFLVVQLQTVGYSCVADWHGVVENADGLVGSLQIGFFLKNLIRNVNKNAVINGATASMWIRSRSGHISTSYELTEPHLTVKRFITVATDGTPANTYETTIELETGLHTESCGLPKKINIDLTPGPNVVANSHPFCSLEVTYVDSPGVYKFTTNIEQVASCGTDLNDSQFRMNFVLSIPTEDNEFHDERGISITFGDSNDSDSLYTFCFGITNVLTFNQVSQTMTYVALQREFLRSTERQRSMFLQKSSDGETENEVSQIVVDIMSHGVYPCDGLFRPMGKMKLKVRVAVADDKIYNSPADPTNPDAGCFEFAGDNQVNPNVNGIDLIPLRDQNGDLVFDDCGSGDPLIRCYHFEASECQPMVNDDAEGTCEFEYRGVADIVVSTCCESVNVQVPAVPCETFSNPGSETCHHTQGCSTPSTQVDVTPEFSINVEAKCPVPWLNMNEEVTLVMTLDDVSPTSPMTFYISEVTVELYDDNGAIPLVTETFDRGLKQHFMTNSDSEFVDDVHFCRDVAADGATCSSFYSLNPTASDATNRYVNIGGLVVYDRCKPSAGAQLLPLGQRRNQDYFTFAPNKWNFNSFNGVSGKLKWYITSVLTSCSEPNSRRILRGLTGEDDVTRVIRNQGEATIFKAPNCYLNKKKCGKSKECSWGTLTGEQSRCLPKVVLAEMVCSQLADGSTCSMHQGCVFTDGLCQERDPVFACGDYVNSKECAADPFQVAELACLWVKGVGCQEAKTMACFAIKSKPICGQRDDCLPKKKKCIDKATSTPSTTVDDCGDYRNKKACKKDLAKVDSCSWAPGIIPDSRCVTNNTINCGDLNKKQCRKVAVCKYNKKVRECETK